jgi:hypothetical protein
MRETEAAARALGMTVQVNWVRDGADFEGAFQSIGRERAEALVFLHPDQVIAAMQRWSEEFIERPHWVVGDLPICPFAKAARLKKTVHFEVLPFDVADPLESNGAILTLVGELPRHQERNTCL